MSRSPVGFVGFMRARWRAWLPVVVITLVLFLVAIFLANGKQIAPFLYRLF